MSIQEAWKAFKTVRDEDIDKELTGNPEYKSLCNTKYALYDSLREKLTGEDRETLNTLDETWAAMDGVSSDVFYFAGLQDGIRLAQQMGLVSSAGSGGIGGNSDNKETVNQYPILRLIVS